MFLQILQQLAAQRPSPGFNAVVTKQNHWIIGPYDELKRLAQALRIDAALRKSFARCGAQVGRRHTDVPPVGARSVTSFRSAIEHKSPKATDATLAKQHAKDRDTAGSVPFTPRFTDQFDEVADFYKDKTLEAHHIVEKSILGTLKVNSGGLANEKAPCVLIAAELHQRLFTVEVASARGLFFPTMTGDKACQELKRIYDQLYLPSDMLELKVSATLIAEEVRRIKKV